MERKGIYKLHNGIIKQYWKSEGECSDIFNEKYLFGSNYNQDNEILTIMFYNRLSREKLWQQNCKNTRFACGHLFLSDTNLTYIDNINLETGKSEWILDFGMKVHGDILKHGNTLIIPLNNDHLLGIDAQTGKRLWELEDCFNYYNLEETTGLLYGYGGERFEIIDAVKGEKVFQKQFDGSMDKYKISVSQHMSTLHGNGLYFTSNKQQIKFGKVNIRTSEIEFVQDLIEDKERIGRTNASKPRFHNGRLYILDSVGTLHIFEEEM